MRNVLNRNGIIPAPVRFGSIDWRRLMKHYKEQILVHDRDSKFTDAFDNVFKSTDFHVIHTPLRAPDTNAYAERGDRTNPGYLDHLLIVNQTHLKRILARISIASFVTGSNLAPRTLKIESLDKPIVLTYASTSIKMFSKSEQIIP